MLLPDGFTVCILTAVTDPANCDPLFLLNLRNCVETDRQTDGQQTAALLTLQYLDKETVCERAVDSVRVCRCPVCDTT
jgi:hypothetical protein